MARPAKPLALVSLLAGGCALFGPRVDSSWGPLQPGARLPPPSAAAIEPPRFALRAQSLPSGLKLGFESGTAVGRVALVTVVGAGSGADPPGKEGLAHLVEHLIYHAHPEGRPRGSDRLTRLGASYNADTGLEATRFYEAGPASALPDLLAIAGERLTHPLAGVDAADLERERSIVENELNQRNEVGVYGNVMAWMQRALFPAGHPYARPVGGSAATLARLTLADARDFVARHYRPENASVLVAGDTDARAPATAVKALEDSARIRSAGAPARAAPPRLQAASDRRASSPAQAPPELLHAAVALPEIWIAYELPNESAQAATVSRVLTGHAAEQMVRERLMPEREVLGVDFHVIEQSRSTILACQVVLEHDRRRDELADKARNLIWALWSDAGPPAAVTWEGWRQETVVDLRHAALADAVLAAEPLVERSLQRATSFHATGAIDGYDRTLGSIGTVQPAAISEQAFTLLAPERARTLFLQPTTHAAAPPPGPVGIPSASNLPIQEGPFRAAELGEPPRSPPPAGLADAHTHTLANGLTVIVLRRPQFPSVTALLGFHGGAAALPAGLLELVRAVEPRRSDAPATPLWRVETADGPGFTADFVETDRHHLDTGLSMLASRLQAVAEMDWERLLEQAQQRRSGRDAAPEEPRRAAMTKLQAALYGSHPLGRRARMADVLGLPPSQPKTWLPRLYNPRNAVLIIAGDVADDEAARLAGTWFGSWRAADGAGRLEVPAVAPPAAPSAAARELILITPRPVTSQVEVTFACRLAPARSARETAAQQVMAGVLEGILTDRIREQAGAAYSIDGAATTVPGGGAHLQVAMSVDSRRLREALRALRGQMAALAAGRLDHGALSQARWSLSGAQTLRFQTGTSLAVAVFKTLALGGPPAALAQQLEELRRVDERDAARAFAPCLAAPILSLVGDEALIRAAL